MLLIAPTYSVAIDPGDQVVAAPGTTLLAEVANDGLLDGTYEATLTLDGTELEDVAVETPAGETATAELAMPDDLSAGAHTVELGGETLDFTALTPPEYKVGKLKVEPDVQKVKATVGVSATVRNVGEAYGTFPGVLKVNGKEAATSDVVVEGNGGTSVVEFELRAPEAGRLQARRGRLEGQGRHRQAGAARQRCGHQRTPWAGGSTSSSSTTGTPSDCMVCLTAFEVLRQAAR